MHKTPKKNYPLHQELLANQPIALLQNRVLITPVEAGAACGWAKQTTYNKLHDDVFPIPLVEFNGRKMVKTSDLLEYIKNLRYVKHIYKKAGRPTKAESIRLRLGNEARAI